MSAGDLAGLDVQPLAEIGRIVHEPARLMIMTVLYVVESADFVFLLRQTGLTRGNLSSHLSKLEKAGYVDVEKEFVDKMPHTLLRLTEAGRAALQAYRQSLAHVLDSLDSAWAAGSGEGNARRLDVRHRALLRRMPDRDQVQRRVVVRQTER